MGVRGGGPFLRKSNTLTKPPLTSPTHLPPPSQPSPSTPPSILASPTRPGSFAEWTGATLSRARTLGHQAPSQVSGPPSGADPCTRSPGPSLDATSPTITITLTRNRTTMGRACSGHTTPQGAGHDVSPREGSLAEGGGPVLSRTRTAGSRQQLMSERSQAASNDSGGGGGGGMRSSSILRSLSRTMSLTKGDIAFLKREEATAHRKAKSAVEESYAASMQKDASHNPPRDVWEAAEQDALPRWDTPVCTGHSSAFTPSALGGSPRCQPPSPLGRSPTVSTGLAPHGSSPRTPPGMPSGILRSMPRSESVPSAPPPGAKFPGLPASPAAGDVSPNGSPRCQELLGRARAGPTPLRGHASLVSVEPLGVRMKRSFSTSQ